VIEYFFQTALYGFGDLYLVAEADLVKKKKKAGPFLAELPERANPWEQRIVELLRQRVAGNADFKRCLEFFDRTEEETAQTAQGEPDPQWVGDVLLRDFGVKAAPLLGVHLVKLKEVWPFWKTAGTLLYLEQLPGRVTSVFLLEFVLTGKSPHFRDMARKALLAKPDAGLAVMVEERLKEADQKAAILRGLAEELRSRPT
jgi:hypothetical protein